MKIWEHIFYVPTEGNNHEHYYQQNKDYEQKTEHLFDSRNTKVLQQQKSTGPRRILESIYSNLNPTAINIDAISYRNNIILLCE